MAPPNPFIETAPSDADDRELIARIKDGSRDALETLIARHQGWIYNIVLRMVYFPQDAEDVTQEILRDNFRQRLARARRDLHRFMQDECGLVNPANPCRCAKKTQAFINAGFVDPKNLLFARAHITRVRDVAPRAHHDIEALDAAYGEVHRDHPFHTPTLVNAIRQLIERPDFQGILERT